MFIDVAQSMIGPNSCLCTTCFRIIEKQCSDKYIVKNVCVVTNCKRSIHHIFKSPWLDNVKCFKMLKEKVCKIILTQAIYRYRYRLKLEYRHCTLIN